MEFHIIGSSMQALSINLKNGERIFADSGKLVSKSANVIMTPRLVGGVVNAVERRMTGATAMLTEFKADGDGSISVSGVLPGKIRHISLVEGETVVAEDNAFLACDDKVKFTLQAIGLGPAFFGGAGLMLQKFTGPGEIFIHVIGDVIEYELDGTLDLEVDPGHIAAFDGALTYKIRFVDNIRTALFGGVGLFLATFNGKGKLLLHSVSRFKLSSEIFLEGLREEKGKKQE